MNKELDQERMDRKRIQEQMKQQRELDLMIERSERRAFWITSIVVKLYLVFWIGVLWRS